MVSLTVWPMPAETQMWSEGFKIQGALLFVERMDGRNMMLDQLSLLLAQKFIAEKFLSALLGGCVFLRRNPSRTPPWQSVHLYSDLKMTGTDNHVYLIYIGNCGVGPLAEELQVYARQYQEDPMDELCIILITTEPAFDGKQSYYQIGPSVLNAAPGTESILTGNVEYHVLSAAELTHKNAPDSIQSLLDNLAGLPDGQSSELLSLMLNAAKELSVSWLENLRIMKKELCRRMYQKSVLAGADSFQALIDCADAEDCFQRRYLARGISWINNLKNSGGYAIFQQKSAETPCGQTCETGMNRQEYRLTYTGDAPAAEDDSCSLQKIIYQFTVDPPEDFWGNRLSLSDIVVLWNGSVMSAQYCGRSGLVPAPAFLDGISSAADLLDEAMGLGGLLRKDSMGGQPYTEADAKQQWTCS